VSVLDTSKLKAADYRLSYDGSVYQLEDVVSKSRREFAQMPIEVDGLSIRQASGAMAAGDSMMIQAGTAYAGRMRSVLRDGSAIASSDVMTVNGSAANKGFTNVRQLAEAEEGKGGLDPVKVTFTANNRYRVEVNGNAVGAEKEFEPDKPFDVEANGWKLTLSGRPAMGDVLEMKTRSAPRQDNANAREMTLLADRHNVDGATFSQAFASLLSDVGSRALQAKTSEKASAKMLEGAKTVLANRSGVNLDEEAARLLQYRQAYQAAAKVIQTADEMFNSILALAR
jgi:flagellar hook-associated protein flgK